MCDQYFLASLPQYWNIYLELKSLLRIEFPGM
uniref:Uncharacterized protein n=1 Tax=Rhizophora mucronata TaxID=61149 RepID=A0A2P2P4E6_RHIMU